MLVSDLSGWISAILVFPILFSCTPGLSVEEDNLEDISCYIPDTVYFKNDVEPLIISKCSGGACHGIASVNGDYSSYNGIISDAISGKISHQIISGNMPLGDSLSPAQKQVILCWIAQGALDNGILEDTANEVIDSNFTDTILVSNDFCDTSNINYSNGIQRILNQKCTFSGCHASGSIFGDYTSLNSIATDADSAGKIWNRVVIRQDMPKGGIKMSQAQRDSIECWTINGGK